MTLYDNPWEELDLLQRCTCIAQTTQLRGVPGGHLGNSFAIFFSVLLGFDGYHNQVLIQPSRVDVIYSS